MIPSIPRNIIPYRSSDIINNEVHVFGDLLHKYMAMELRRKLVGAETTATVTKGSDFRRLVIAKFEEEMASHLTELTAQEFLDCGYGHEIAKYGRARAKMERRGARTARDLSESLSRTHPFLQEIKRWHHQN